MQTSWTDARFISLHEGEQPIPGYRLVRRRGRGGFGEVWEAEASGGFLVALKFVRLSNRARAAELRALEFVRGIHHPNLLANFGSWLVGDTLIIGMELADRSLWDRYVEAAQQGHRGIPRGELLGYLAEVAAGIDHLNDYRHTFDGRTSIGVQHRDLKPPNILLFGGGAKVADLGMARTMEGEVAGHTGVWTFPYAAPEFFRGETTRQSDQYGLAATFCQLCGGRLPFGGNAASVTAGHLFARPDLEALPEPERPIVERALAKVPGDRWPNCRAFVEALRALPADAVADILIDPDGPSSVPRESHSLDNGYYCSLGFATAGSGVLDSGWSQPISSSGSTFDPGFDTGPSGFAGSLAMTGDDLPSSADAVPTLVIAALSPPPASEAAPELARRPARPLRHAVATVATALVLATVAIRASNRDPGPRATPGPRDSSPAPAIAAEPTPPRPSSAPPDEAPAPPILPVEVAEIRAAGEPRLEPVPSSPGPAIAEPIALAPELTLAPPEPQPSTIAPAVAEETLPRLAASGADRPDLVLEGPIEMGTLAPGARSVPGERRVAGVVARAVPPVVAPDPGVPPPRPPAALEEVAKEKVASPPVPDRSVPGPDSRLVARNAPAATPGLARNLDLARPTPTDRAGPVAAEAAFARGRQLFHQNSFAQAVAEFDESIRLNPGHVTSYLVRAIARHRAGDPRAALPDYAEVIRVRPDDVTAYVSRGQAYHELGDYGRAIADYGEAIRRRPADGEARFRRGLARYHAGDFTGSIGDFTETLRLDRNNPYAAEFRSEALARLDAKTTPAPSRETSPNPPSPLGAAPSEAGGPPAQAGAAPLAAVASVAPGPSAVRETSHLAPPPAAAPTAGVQPRNPTPAPRRGTNPNPAERRRSPVRRFLPWPLSKPR